MAERTEDVAREENALARRFLPETRRGRGVSPPIPAIPRDSDADPFHPSNRHAPLRAWDRAYAMGRARTATCGVDASAVARFFPLESTIRGVGALVSRVFGVTVEEEPLHDAEKWCDDAKKLTLRTRDGDLLGTVYLDLSRRPRKFPHAAHFVVRCSRDAREGPASRKRPVVALVCNFGGGAGCSAGALLSHGEVETFLHEFGHAMHSALSETKYQHASGTRCAADLVEVPSHLFEYFAWDPDALRILSRERTTGEPMPSAMIDALRRGKEMFGATDLRQQIAFALADLDAHSIAASDVEPRHVSAAFADAARSAGFRPEPGASWELRFGHLVGYASTITQPRTPRRGGAEGGDDGSRGTRSRRAPGRRRGTDYSSTEAPSRRTHSSETCWGRMDSGKITRAGESRRIQTPRSRSWACGDWSGERRTRESIRGPPSVGDGARTSERSSERNSRRKRSGGLFASSQDVSVARAGRRFSPRRPSARARTANRRHLRFRERQTFTFSQHRFGRASPGTGGRFLSPSGVDSPSSIPRRRFDACDSRLTRARAPVCSPRRDTSHRLFRWPTRRSRPVRGVSRPATGRCLRPLARARTSPRRF